MTRSIFGWDLPPGCTIRDIEQAQESDEEREERERQENYKDWRLERDAEIRHEQQNEDWNWTDIADKGDR